MTTVSEVDFPVIRKKIMRANMVGLLEIAMYGHAIDGDNVELMLTRFTGRKVRIVIEDLDIIDIKESNAPTT